LRYYNICLFALVRKKNFLYVLKEETGTAVFVPHNWGNSRLFYCSFTYNLHIAWWLLTFRSCIFMLMQFLFINARLAIISCRSGLLHVVIWLLWKLIGLKNWNARVLIINCLRNGTKNTIFWWTLFTYERPLIMLA
jgi:hypothetical protein